MSFRKYRARGIPVPKYETGPNCEGCPVRKWSQGFVPGQGNVKTAQYMMLAENPAFNEVKTGIPLSGGSGDIVNGVLRDYSTLRRSDFYIDNVVKCRTIKWPKCPQCKGAGCEKETEVFGYALTCQEGQIPVINEFTRDFENANPSADQAKLCSQRYLFRTLKDFQGDVILGLGATTLHAIAERNIGIEQYQGSVFEKGEVKTCEACAGSGINI